MTTTFQDNATTGVTFKDVEPLPNDLSEDNPTIESRGIFYPTPTHDGAMARIRVPAGRLISQQLRDIASIADDLTTGYIQITTRGNLQIRVIQPENTEEVLTRLRKTGLHPAGPGADNPRNLTANPTSGFDPHELIDTTSWCLELERRLTSSPHYHNIPGKFNLAIDTGGQASVMEDSNDLSAHAVQTFDDNLKRIVKFRISLGGATEDKDLGILVSPVHLTETLLATIGVQNQLRDQSNRLRARAKYLWDSYNKEEILEELRKELPARIPLIRTNVSRSAHLSGRDLPKHPQAGIFDQKQPGLHYIGIAVPVGQVTTHQLRCIARLADEFGSGDIRLTVWQNLILPDIPTLFLETVKEQLLQAGLHWKQSNLRSGIIACTGSQHCPYAKADTKAHAIELGDYLDERLHIDHPINIHFTGCPFSCAQHYVGDIGLLAAKPTQDNTPTYHLFVGGGFGRKRSLGRKISESPIPFPTLKPTILQLLINWLTDRKSSETFQEFSNRTFPSLEPHLPIEK